MADAIEQPTLLDHDRQPKDLRSASVPYKRDAAEGFRYGYFKDVNRGDVGQDRIVVPCMGHRAQQCADSCWGRMGPVEPSESRMELWTKRKLFREAQDTRPHYTSVAKKAIRRCEWGLPRRANVKRMDFSHNAVEDMKDEAVELQHDSSCVICNSYRLKHEDFEDGGEKVHAPDNEGIECETLALPDYEQQEHLQGAFGTLVDEAAGKWEDKRAWEQRDRHWADTMRTWDLISNSENEIRTQEDWEALSLAESFDMVDEMYERE